jgi:hypothetical protein
VRAKDAVHHHQRQHHQHHHHPVVLALVELVAEERGLLQLDAHRAVREEAHLVDEDLDDGAEGQRHHGQVGPRHAQRRQRQQRAEARREQNREGHRDPERRRQLEHQHAGRIRAQSEQARVAQRDLAGVADHDVQPEQHDRVDHDGLQQVDVVRVVDAYGKQQQCGHAGDGQQQVAGLHFFRGHGAVLIPS